MSGQNGGRGASPNGLNEPQPGTSGQRIDKAELFGLMQEFMSMQRAQKQPQYSSSESSDSPDSDSDSSSDESDRGRKRRKSHAKRHYAKRRRASSSRSQSPRRRRSRERFQNTQDGRAQSDSEEDDFGELRAILQSSAAKPNVASNTQQQEGFEDTIREFEAFFEAGDKVGAAVNDGFAGIFNSSLRRRPNEKALLSMADRYPLPANVPNLMVPKTNDTVYEHLRKGPRIVDAHIQKVHTCLSKALVPLIGMINDIGEGTAKTKRMDDYHQPITDAIRLSSAAFSMLSQTRKEVMRNDMKYPFGKLCTWQSNVGVDKLFGDDVLKQLKDVRETARQLGEAYGKPGHGYGGGFSYKKKSYGGNGGKFRKRQHSNRGKGYKGHKGGKDKGEPEVCQVKMTPVAKPSQKFKTNQIEIGETGQATSSNTQMNLNNNAANFKAGKLSDNYSEWQKLTSDKWILNVIRGYCIEFSDIPMQHRMPHQIKLNSTEQAALDIEISDFIKSGIVEPCTPNEPGSFYGNLFTRPKKDGSVRVIFNLKKLTPFLDKHHFKMETVKHVILMMRPNCLFSSIDFKHAFFSVQIDPKYRKFLRFVWNNKHYQFTCMPQGLGPASRIFTKILKPAFAHLRGLGLEICGYIDDSISIHDDNDDEYEATMNYAVQFFDKLGFTINTAKSVLPPVRTKIIEHLGFVFNSESMTVELTIAKKDCIHDLASKLLESPKPTVQDLAQLVGKLVASEPGFSHAPLYYKQIEIYKNQELAIHHGNYNVVIHLPDAIIMEIQWWKLHVHNVKRQVQQINPEHVIESDASNTGWGGIIDNTLKTRGQWSADEMKLHINLKELQAAFFMLQSFCQNYHDTHIRLKLDNTTAVACINRMASTKPSLMKMTKQIWVWAIERQIHLSAEHLPGRYNCIADHESRAFDNLDAEWMLKKTVFEAICDKFGMPDIDMFASRINSQLPGYYAWRPDPGALAIDAFQQHWDKTLRYAFPPFSIIARVLQKVELEGATIILVFPIWPTQAWFPRALKMTIDTPYLLPQESLTLPQNPAKKHPLPKLRLAAMKLSGAHCRQRSYHLKQSVSSAAPGEMALINNTKHTWTNGQRFVVRGKSISFRPLFMNS